MVVLLIVGAVWGSACSKSVARTGLSSSELGTLSSETELELEWSESFFLMDEKEGAMAQERVRRPDWRKQSSDVAQKPDAARSPPAWSRDRNQLF